MTYTHAFEAIGTPWRIDTDLPLNSPTITQISSTVAAFDLTYSRFRSDSLVAEMARRPGVYRFPDDAVALFGLYRQLYDYTHGAVTPLVGQALEHLGYNAGYTLRRTGERVTVPPWDDVMSVDGTVITTYEPLLLDVGAAGKGLLVDLIAELLDAAGVSAYVVDASGDLIHTGTTVERIGLEHPDNPKHVIGIAHVSNQALCASATNRRRWGPGLHHIINPATSEPADATVATWVTHPSCAVADGLATALFLVEPAQLAPAFDFGYVRLHQTGSLDYSTNFNGELFI